MRSTLLLIFLLLRVGDGWFVIQLCALGGCRLVGVVFVITSTTTVSTASSVVVECNLFLKMHNRL